MEKAEHPDSEAEVREKNNTVAIHDGIPVLRSIAVFFNTRGGGRILLYTGWAVGYNQIC